MKAHQYMLRTHCTFGCAVTTKGIVICGKMQLFLALSLFSRTRQNSRQQHVYNKFPLFPLSYFLYSFYEVLPYPETCIGRTGSDLLIFWIAR